MREEARQFGEDGRLVGVLTLPDATPGTVCILVSAGLVPRFGPFRLYTQLARRLAVGHGIATLRFDLGGIGDSDSAPTGALETRTHADLRAAVDHVSAMLPDSRIVLGGLCSGAEDSFKYAEGDARVGAVAMIDPFAFPTHGTAWRFFAFRLRRRLLHLFGAFVPLPMAPGTGAVVNYSYLERSVATRILRALLERHVGVHFVYTGGRLELFNHRRQLQRMFPELDLRDRVTLDLLPHMDHTQVLQADRDAVIDAIASRLAQATPSGPGRTSRRG